MRARWCFACAHRRRRHPCHRRAFIWAGRVRAPPHTTRWLTPLAGRLIVRALLPLKLLLEVPPSNFCGRPRTERAERHSRDGVVRQRRRTAAPALHAGRWTCRCRSSRKDLRCRWTTRRSGRRACLAGRSSWAAVPSGAACSLSSYGAADALGTGNQCSCRPMLKGNVSLVVSATSSSRESRVTAAVCGVVCREL